MPDYGWRHHPAARVWRGHLEAPTAYGLAIVAEEDGLPYVWLGGLD